MKIQHSYQGSSSHRASSRKYHLRCRAADQHDVQTKPSVSQSHVNVISGYDSVVTHELRVKLGQTQREVLRGVNLKIKRGHLHMLLGPNGCGKSTLLKLLGGLIPQYEGTVQLDQPSGFVFQNPDHQVVMPTVAADVAFGLGRYTLKEEVVLSSVTSSLKLVNMQNYMYRATHTLSGGQRQRVAIAGALAENPKLLLLDELTTFLDVEDQFGVLEAVRNITHVKGDVTAIWVTHRFEELEYADSASYMQDGSIVSTGRPERIRSFLRTLGASVPQPSGK
ncbi:hypothetical protein CEUSTIGMA_g2849.t1 [Chlamydomonas eustigma]|uniref:ABC transporter domain-containing protein n=1 Tax=Chlamydomonas eustigma TaxID=1157962 RepID=A0A250WX98_9CHLO|nr:hypothetical protein CEUSTIGMA_g2849.t1 [Chlamydomonas eustigma]|eukprot:GAX75405.1 hypothetical protein CEUSTIGMA_g2849.t1 [Chlamydomonas eustigma]